MPNKKGVALDDAYYDYSTASMIRAIGPNSEVRLAPSARIL